MAIVVNKPIPEFEANATGGIKVSNTSHLGHVLVLYFYPKDNTPGCTTEAMQFRDRYKDFVKAGATVFGVSRDNMKSHDEVQGQARAALRTDRRHRRKDVPHVRRGQEQDHVRQEGQGHRAQHLPDRRRRRAQAPNGAA